MEIWNEKESLEIGPILNQSQIWGVSIQINA